MPLGEKETAVSDSLDRSLCWGPRDQVQAGPRRPGWQGKRVCVLATPPQGQEHKQIISVFGGAIPSLLYTSRQPTTPGLSSKTKDS